MAEHAMRVRRGAVEHPKMHDDGPITLSLGPTNTGKTHNAIERLLDHRSGIIGLPLRLLAREVYDRLVLRVGASEVALLTGEERQIPVEPRYWVCTVEAMPPALCVGPTALDMVAVDEIQLCADRERGHVFTDRLLRARGRLETLFMGADTLGPLAKTLLPHAELKRRPRLSDLSHAGTTGLGGLKPRSVVVGFSSEAVYELAARLRHRKGGAAVVLGALSPRTRNAQVELYQSGEVQYLVATDAIGMGLNLDVDHVAFASVRKFDGKEHRPLRPAELAQIAGRAGRHLRPGTFGTLNPQRGLEPRVVGAIENHRFAPLKRLQWRNADLNFSSLQALSSSLAHSPPHRCLRRTEDAADAEALRLLCSREQILDRAQGPQAIGLLWEICQIPDYEQSLLLRHLKLMETLFTQLVDGRPLNPDWMNAQLSHLDRVDGDVDGLTARLASIRVWTYISQRNDWLVDAAFFQERARSIEDRLGDALHASLVTRFVERGAKRKRPRPSHEKEAQSGNAFAALADLLTHEGGPGSALEAWAQKVVDAESTELEIDANARLLFDGKAVCTLVRGRQWSRPDVLAEQYELGAELKARFERAARAHGRSSIGRWLSNLDAAPDNSPALQGLLYQLREGLGTLDRIAAQPQIDTLTDGDRRFLDERGIRIGNYTIFSESLMRPQALKERALLLQIHGVQLPQLPESVVGPLDKTIAPRVYLALGWLPLGPYLFFGKTAEEVARCLAPLGSDAETLDIVEASNRLRVKKRRRPALLKALGFGTLARSLEGSAERSP